MEETVVRTILDGRDDTMGKQDVMIGKQEFTPRTKENMCYIVATVIINDLNEVLIMQEAKRSCRGEWYLPAGRVEPNETLFEASQREVMEETGMECQPLSLFQVEFNMPLWIRFNFVARVTGGTLKTTAEADEESLQAQWVNIKELSKINLRCRDILSMIDKAIAYQNAASKHPPQLPQIIAHKALIHRCMFYQVLNDGQEVHVLQYCHADNFGLPSTTVNVGDFKKHGTFRRVLYTCLKKQPQEKIPIILKGILRVEHSGKPKHENDGTSFTFLIQVPANKGPNKLHEMKDNFTWTKLDDNDRDFLMQKASDLGSTDVVMRGAGY